MNKIIFFILASLLITACAEDNKPDSPNSYSEVWVKLRFIALELNERGSKAYNLNEAIVSNCRLDVFNVSQLSLRKGSIPKVRSQAECSNFTTVNEKSELIGLSMHTTFTSVNGRVESVFKTREHLHGTIHPKAGTVSLTPDSYIGEEGKSGRVITVGEDIMVIRNTSSLESLNTIDDIDRDSDLVYIRVNATKEQLIAAAKNHLNQPDHDKVKWHVSQFDPYLGQIKKLQDQIFSHAASCTKHNPSEIRITSLRWLTTPQEAIGIIERLAMAYKNKAFSELACTIGLESIYVENPIKIDQQSLPKPKYYPGGSVDIYVGTPVQAIIDSMTEFSKTL